MQIAVKSEIDSRVLVYPMIKALSLYGTVCVFTNNKNFTRLIENELEGGFKNISINVSLDADLEAMKQSVEFFSDKFDFTIYDNVGAVDYDILIVPISNRLSASFIEDLVYVAADPKTHIMKFGNPASGSSSQKSTLQNKSSNKGNSTEVDMDFNKWNKEKSDKEILQEMLQNRNAKWCKFPTWDAIEEMESRRKMISPDDGLIKELYRILGSYLNVDERQFTKGARVKDESGSDIDGTDVR